MAKPTLTSKLALFVLSLAAVNVQAKWNDVDVKTLPFVAVPRETVAGKAQSLLPPGKRWKLVWHDEFDQKEIDPAKAREKHSINQISTRSFLTYPTLPKGLSGYSAIPVIHFADNATEA